MPKEQKETVNHYLNIDKAINIYNEKNPNLRKMTKTSLAEMVGVSAQKLTNLKTTPLPKNVSVIFEIQKIVGCKLDEIISDKNG